MDPSYLQSVIREDFVPMAKKCYEELLTRQPDAGGRIMMTFKIVGDDKLGGIVEDAAVEADGGVADEKMSTCVRESLSTLAFRPPADDDVVTIVYPVVFNPKREPDE